jgi:hypothetical protein
MEIMISVDGIDKSAALESLHDWLRGDPDLVGVAQRKAPPRQGQMGSLTEALTVAVGTGGALSILASALRAWVLQPRNSHVRVRLETHRNGHRMVEIDADRARAEDVKALLSALQEPEEGQQPEEGEG